MAENHSPRYGKKRKKQSNSAGIVMLLVVLMAALVIFALALRLLLGSPQSNDPAQAEVPSQAPTEVTEQSPSRWERLFGSKETEPPETEPPEPEPQPPLQRGGRGPQDGTARRKAGQAPGGESESPSRAPPSRPSGQGPPGGERDA